MSRQPAEVSVQFVQQMNEKFPIKNAWDRQYKVVAGRRYDKVVTFSAANPLGMAAEAFIDPENGDMFKPAGWSGPAKGVRYNLVRQGVAAVVGKADNLGGYLYR
jgi:hypothetical protein